jgi:hypothetical protein
MLLESGHVGEDYAFVFEEGAAPLHGFDNGGTGLVDQFADVRQDGLREGFGFGDVDVNSGIEALGWAQVPLLKYLENSVTGIDGF